MPTWAALALLVAAGAWFAHAFAARLPGPWIFPDELLYGELARSIGAGEGLLVRDAPADLYALVYPALLAPAFALFESVPDAYAAAKAINAVLVSLAAVPAFLIARRFLSRLGAFAAAALAVAVPSTVYAGMLMSENAFYPVFLAAVLAIVAVLDRPTAARQLAALAALGLAFLTRPQGVALVPILLTSILLVAALDVRRAGAPFLRAYLRSLGRFRLTWALVAAGPAALTILQLVRGASLVDLLGIYAPTVGGQQLSEIPRWFLYHVAELDLYVGILPFAAFVLLLVTQLRSPTAPRELRVLLVVTAAAIVWTALLVAAFSATPSAAEGYVELPPRIHERYMFYCAPLLLIAFVAWLAGRAPRPRRAAVAAAAVAGVLPALIPVDEVGHNASFEALALIVWSDTPLDRTVLAGLSLAFAAFFAFLAPRRRAIAVALVLLSFAGTRLVAETRIEALAEHNLAAAVAGDRDWIDRRVGGHADVAVLSVQPEGITSHGELFAAGLPVWESEFFNRSVGRVYYVGTRLPYALPDEHVGVAADGVVRDASGTAVRSDYVLAPASVRVQAVEVARDRAGMTLYRVRGPLRVDPRAVATMTSARRPA